MKKTTQSSTASNVTTFLKSVQGKVEAPTDPHELILAALTKGPASLAALKKLTNLQFTDLDTALTRLQQRKLIRTQDDNNETTFSLTSKGEDYAALS